MSRLEYCPHGLHAVSYDGEEKLPSVIHVKRGRPTHTNKLRSASSPDLSGLWLWSCWRTPESKTILDPYSMFWWASNNAAIIWYQNNWTSDGMALVFFNSELCLPCDSKWHVSVQYKKQPVSQSFSSWSQWIALLCSYYLSNFTFSFYLIAHNAMFTAQMMSWVHRPQW